MNKDLIRTGLDKVKESGKPAFIYAHFLPPHWPYRPPRPYASRYVSNPKFKYSRLWQLKELLDNQMRAEAITDIETHHLRYKNNLFYADVAAQELLDLLKDYDLYEDSLIIITADHGEAFAEHGQIGHNTTVYDEMIRVPLIISFPGAEPAVVEQQVGLIDIFPTLVEILDLDADCGHFQGRSLAPLLVGGDLDPVDYYYSRAVGTDPIFTLRGQQLKYIYNDYFEALYDLESDPGEKINIIDRHPVLATYLRQSAFVMIAYNSGLRGDEGEEFTISEKDAEDLRKLGYLQ